MLLDKEIEYSSIETFILSLLMSIAIPIILSFVLFCLYSYVSVGVSCFEKIGTEESWDLLETFWFFSIILDY